MLPVTGDYYSSWNYRIPPVASGDDLGDDVAAVEGGLGALEEIESSDESSFADEETTPLEDSDDEMSKASSDGPEPKWDPFGFKLFVDLDYLHDLHGESRHSVCFSDWHEWFSSAGCAKPLAISAKDWNSDFNLLCFSAGLKNVTTKVHVNLSLLMFSRR